MAGDEDQAQQVVADVVVERGVEVGRRRSLLRLELVAELLVLALEQLVAAQLVDGAVLRGRHQPGARVVRDARLRPLLERGDERVLRQLLGEADVAHDARQPGDEPRRLDPPDRVDRAMRLGGRHGDSMNLRLAPIAYAPSEAEEGVADEDLVAVADRVLDDA